MDSGFDLFKEMYDTYSKKGTDKSKTGMWGKIKRVVATMCECHGEKF